MTHELCLRGLKLRILKNIQRRKGDEENLADKDGAVADIHLEQRLQIESRRTDQKRNDE